MMATKMAYDRNMAELQREVEAARRAGRPNHALEDVVKRLTEAVHRALVERMRGSHNARDLEAEVKLLIETAKKVHFRRGGGKRRTTRKSR